MGSARTWEVMPGGQSARRWQEGEIHAFQGEKQGAKDLSCLQRGREDASGLTRDMGPFWPRGPVPTSSPSTSPRHKGQVLFQDRWEFLNSLASCNTWLF